MGFVLYTSVVCLGLFVLLQWLWKRRDLYWLSWKLPGPFALPLLGNFFDMMDRYGKLFRNFSFILQIFYMAPGNLLAENKIYTLQATADNIKIFTKFSVLYGSLYRFWLGPTLYVMLSDPSDLENILHNTHCTDKDDSYRFFEEGFATIGLFTLKSQKWKRHRKLITPSFNARSVNLYLPIFNKRLHDFVKTLSSKVDQESFNIHSTCSVIFLQMILDTTIGYNISEEDMHAYTKFLAEGGMVATKRYFNPFYRIDWVWKLTNNQAIVEKRRKYREDLFEKIIKERKAVSDEERVLFLDRLLKIAEENSDFTMVDVIGEGNTSIMAGTDTSTVSLSTILLMLAMHPTCQENVYDELKANFPSKDTEYITMDELDKLSYTDMCMKEALRIFPTVPAVARKATQDFQLRDHIIPAGTSLGIDIFNIHRSKKYWGDNADQYVPERFASDLLHPYSYMVFSHGPRNCIGYRYALAAMKLALVYLLLNYRFTTPLKMTDLNYYAEININFKEKHMVQIHNR